MFKIKMFDRKKYHKEYYMKNKDKLKTYQKKRYYNREIIEGKLTIKKGIFVIKFD